ncbi:MAG: D-alanyl-D-alanine carboxypeptidase/D-alanyl-D-alanine-endopeptidase [Cyanobacteria bacterium QS_8_64_29]|nr:MAG: D-alanyl-D-alanine carboxypeptidase/D-alanyl-D-alanine-endopeptidase [Cyanobacteria bacterium QS_8_64_29]
MALLGRWLSAALLGPLAGGLPAADAALAAEPVPAEQQRRLCRDELATAIDAIAEGGALERARWGVLVRTLEGGRTLYARHPRQYFTPASNAKLLTTAAALRELGGSFRFQTPAYATGSPPELATLRIFGRWDPSLKTRDLERLAQQLARQGVRRIERAIADRGGTPGPTVPPTWAWEDAYAAYGAIPDPFMLNGNAAPLQLQPRQLGQPLRLRWRDPVAARQWDLRNRSLTVAAGSTPAINMTGRLGTPVLRVGGQLPADAESQTWQLSVPQPGRYWVQTLQSALRDRGIAVGQASVASSRPPERDPLATLSSPPLAELVATTNRQSNNLYAEALFRKLGARSVATTGSRAIEQVLSEIGVPRESYALTDGSGLSRHNRISPQALVATLRQMAQTPQASVYRDSLAVAGRSGTLQERLQGTAAAGRLQGKTGTMTGVSALSGYLETGEAPTLTFAILLNRSGRNVPTMRAAIDRIVQRLARWPACAPQ